ncbi:MAG: hypothetical protein E7492_05680 [Ruminococcaceae bacterium]|nr:hypothetical protein [Oscillospiraceae bacterium]
MSQEYIALLEEKFKKCTAQCGMLHPEYEELLDRLMDMELDQQLVDYLCEKTASKKHWLEIRFYHLRILLLNKSAHKFDLKQFYYENQKRSRRLWFRLFLIRGYAIYATEEELKPVINNFRELLKRNHDYIDYEDILSVAGLPYLVKTYNYDCCISALAVAKEEYLKTNEEYRGRFTRNENLEHVNLISPYEKKYLTTKKLYEKIIDMPDLHSVPVYDEKQNIIIWHLWEDFHMVANCESGDGYISVETDKLSKKKWRTHWHSREEDMAITLYELGKKGNILVLKSFLGATGTVYYGNPDNYTHHTSFAHLYLKQK